MTPLASTQGLTGLVFLCTVLFTIGGAWIAVTARRLIRSVAGLALACIGLAGLFYFLNSPFVALMEILIYVGAVCVAIVFGIMLAPPRMEDRPTKPFNLGAAGGFVAAGIFFLLLYRIGKRTAWMVAGERLNDGSVAEIGRSLLTTYSMVFELISLLLLVAILGALVVARAGRTLPGRN
ncbi:MAG: NADH-quinone oxidoreductase subunit J [Thermodesulfobacteriota bacterium]